MDTNTDGVDTEGSLGGLDPQFMASFNSKEGSQTSLKIIKSGQLALKQQKRTLDALPLLSSRNTSPNTKLAPLPNTITRM